MFLPLVFKSSGLRCLIVGGGEVACRKLETLCDIGCSVTIVAPRIQNVIQERAQRGSVQWIPREYQSGDCRGFQLVVAATERRPVNQAVSEEAKALGIPVNVVDDPELCTVIFPAVWRQGPLTISVSTEGVAPYMAAAVRDRLAAQGSQLARWVETAGRFRSVVRSEITDWNEKNLLYWQFVDAIHPGDPADPPASTKLRDWIDWMEQVKARKQSEL
jgi:uroporphyrin-III C-methyltransferase / precorrin-2 dehydrogenase / sirohydrochlorin ferrochelatase